MKKKLRFVARSEFESFEDESSLEMSLLLHEEYFGGESSINATGIATFLVTILSRTIPKQFQTISNAHLTSDGHHVQTVN